MVSGSALDLAYIKGIVQNNNSSTEETWTFELGVEEGPNLPLHVIVGFMQSKQLHHQTPNNDKFCQPSV